MTTSYWLFIDFDNTMMATEQFSVPSLIARVNELYREKLSHPLTLEEFKKHFHGQSRQSLCKNLSDYFGVQIEYELLYKEREWYLMQHFQQLEGGVPMAPGIIEALTLLQRQGVTLSFVSNNPIQRAMTAMRFASNGRGEELARLFGCHYFEAGDVQKPNPAVYLRALQQVGADPLRSFAIEDSSTGVTAARSAGLATIAFTGYAENSLEAQKRFLQEGCIGAFSEWEQFASLFTSLTETHEKTS